MVWLRLHFYPLAFAFPFLLLALCVHYYGGWVRCWFFGPRFTTTSSFWCLCGLLFCILPMLQLVVTLLTLPCDVQFLSPLPSYVLGYSVAARPSFFLPSMIGISLLFNRSFWFTTAWRCAWFQATAGAVLLSAPPKRWAGARRARARALPRALSRSPRTSRAWRTAARSAPLCSTTARGDAFRQTGDAATQHTRAGYRLPARSVAFASAGAALRPPTRDLCRCFAHGPPGSCATFPSPPSDLPAPPFLLVLHFRAIPVTFFLTRGGGP